ncbi:MAG TPA: DsbA family protein [Steroidobacteraceae bacterium]|nr:DsbA family protein [Steroidobacteraceae bacterium]
MFKRSFTLAALLIGSLAACAQGSAPATSSSAPATPIAAPTASAPVPGGSLSGAVSAQETVSATPAGTSPSDAQLERIAELPANGQLPAGEWVAGTNYKPIVPTQPTSVTAGKVEVLEFFWYACPHCYAFDPFLESWKKVKAPYIEFRRVPIMWGALHQSHARLFYTLEALGKEEQLHTKVMDTISQRKSDLGSPDEATALRLQVAFAKDNGITEADYVKAYNSFSVQANLQKASELAKRYQVEGVPFIVVNGKYATDVGMAGDHGKLIRLINDLAASEHRH